MSSSLPALAASTLSLEDRTHVPHCYFRRYVSAPAGRPAALTPPPPPPPVCRSLLHAAALTNPARVSLIKSRGFNAVMNFKARGGDPCMRMPKRPCTTSTPPTKRLIVTSRYSCGARRRYENLIFFIIPISISMHINGSGPQIDCTTHLYHLF